MSAAIVPATPFTRVLVPYDGSEPASAALSYGIGFAVAGARLFIINVVDEIGAMVQLPDDSLVPVDRRPLLAELDAHGQALLAAAKGRAQAAKVQAEFDLCYDIPVAAIAAAAQMRSCDLIVMGTHARSGLARLFTGSTTDGVLRTSGTPVLTVRHPLPASGPSWSRVLAAVDDSDAADAAVRLAQRLVGSVPGALILCHAADTQRTREMAAMYGYDPTQFIDEQDIDARLILERAAARAEIAPGSCEFAVVDGEPAAALATAAGEHHADLVVIGSHGRRGVQRLFLGSVAEHVVRTSPVPVLVVRGFRS